MLKRRDRSIAIFSLSALDVLAMTTGTFVLLLVILMPYYRMTYDAGAEMETLRAEASPLLAAVEAERRAGGEARAAAERLRSEAEALSREAGRLDRQTADLERAAAAAQERRRTDEREAEAIRAEVRRQVIPALDLVFVIDTTASMRQVLRELALGAAGIVRVLERIVPSVRVGIVAYRDYELPGWLVRELPLTPTASDLDAVVGFASGLEVSSIGGPTVTEAVLAGLETALAMPFRPYAQKTVIVIGDAAAHRREAPRTLALAREAGRGGGPRISTLFVPTDSYRRYGKGDREFFRALASAGGGEAHQKEGELAEAVLLSVLED